MKAVAVIPARYASTRLPEKPLLDICGKPLIQHVWETVSRARGLDEVVVATDDARIAHAVESFGGRVCMTSLECRSGFDRVQEVAESLAADVYVNVQGDEPLLGPSAIERLPAVSIEDESAQVATLCSRISEEQTCSPHQVKVCISAARRFPLCANMANPPNFGACGHLRLQGRCPARLCLPVSLSAGTGGKTGTAPFSPGRYCHPRAGSAADGCVWGGTPRKTWSGYVRWSGNAAVWLPWKS